VWLPPSDGHGELSGFDVIGDTGEAVTQFNGSRLFTALLEGFADRGSIGFGDHEHGRYVGRPGSEHQASS